MKNNFIPIRKIKIEKLFWLYDYEIEINDWVSIVIWENWIGKTKILNIVYSILNEDLRWLLEFDFDIVKIYFNKWFWKMLKIKKSDIYKKSSKEDLDINNYPLSIRRNYDELRDVILQNNIRDYKQLYNLWRHSFHGNIVHELSMRRYSPRLMNEFINWIYSNIIKNDEINNITNNREILYFPTYRRIEEDIFNLWINIDDVNDRKYDSKIKLINFWMTDVKKLFEGKEEEIKAILAEWITRLTWDILSELYDIKSKKDRIKKVDINIDSLKIVLNRVSDFLKSRNTTNIIKICENWEINWDNYLSLKSVLLAFIEQYNKQKEKEDIIIKFKNVCNNYLNNKELFYDNSKIKIWVKLSNWEEINLSHLSSWEKQIISILSKIYLNPNEKYIILFDEPELSLSISWQETLLKDILGSWNIYFLMAVTHSPFIVGESLQKYANFINNKNN